MRQVSQKTLVRSLDSENFAIQHVQQLKNKVQNPTSLNLRQPRTCYLREVNVS